jgi:hypothetical protein
MPRYEEYKAKKIANANLEGDAKINDMEEFFANKHVDFHTLNPETRDKIFDYDADQLKEYFDKRFSDESDFAMRTEYYFRNFSSANKKREEYLALSNTNEVNAIDRHAARYPRFFNRASKRKSSARDASDYYNTMCTKIVNAQNDDNNPNLTSVEKYRNKEDIMTYRLKAMTAAAEVKSKSSSHEKYLKSRAKLSCYMALKDQLDHYIEDEQNAQLRNTLVGKRRSLTAKINDAYQTLKDVTPKALDMWRKESGINSRAIADTRAICRNMQNGYPNMNTDSAKLLLNLEKIKEENRQNDWPLQLYLQDTNTAALNKAESEKWSWNASYSTAKEPENPNAQRVREMDLQAFERFDKMHVPTPQELGGKGTYKYVYDNLRDYYEIFYKALPYYLSANVPAYVRERMSQNPGFMSKLQYLAAARTYIEFKLRKDNHILVGADGSSRVEPQGQRQQYARDAETAALRTLQQAYATRQGILQNQGQANNQQIAGGIHENIHINEHAHGNDNIQNENNNADSSNASIIIHDQEENDGSRLDDPNNSFSSSSHYVPTRIQHNNDQQSQLDESFSVDQQIDEEEKKKQDRLILDRYNSLGIKNTNVVEINGKSSREKNNNKEEDLKEDDKDQIILDKSDDNIIIEKNDDKNNIIINEKEDNKNKIIINEKKDDEFDNLIIDEEEKKNDNEIILGEKNKDKTGSKSAKKNNNIIIEEDDLLDNISIDEEQEKNDKVNKKANKNKIIISETSRKETSKVNKNVVANQLPRTVNDAYKELENQFKGQKVTKADMALMKDVTKATYEHDRAFVHSIPKNVYDRLEKNPPAGIDARGLLSLMRPVKVDKNGYPVNEEEEKKLALNVSDCLSLMDNKLSSRKAFLDRIAKEAVGMMFTMDQLKDKKYIIANKERAIRHLGFMHDLLNIYNKHSDYFLKEADPSVRNALFTMVSGTEYINTASYYIQRALYSGGLKKPVNAGGKGAASTITFDSEIMSYEQLKEENKKLDKMTPNQAKLYASEFNSLINNREDPYEEDEVEKREILMANSTVTVHSLGVGGAIIAKNEYKKKNDKSEISQSEIEKIIKKYCDPYAGKNKDTKKTDALVGDAIEKYQSFEGTMKETMDKNIINDLKEDKKKKTGRKSSEDKKNQNVINENKIIIEDNKLTKAELAEVEKYRKKCKRFNETSLRLMQAYDGYNQVRNNKELQALYQKAKTNIVLKGGSKTMDRQIMMMMKIAHYDKKGNPISKTDKQNHEWNKKYLQAFIDDDAALREEMVAEYLPHIYDKVKLPPPPTAQQEKELKEGKPDSYFQVLEKWAEDVVQGDFEAIVPAMMCGYSLDTVKVNSQHAEKFMKDNPGFLAKSNAADAAFMYLDLYTTSKYGISHGDYLDDGDPYTEGGYMSADMRKEVFVSEVGKKMGEYQKHNNDDELKPYELTTETEKDREKEYADLKKLQPGFTREGYKLYRIKKNLKEIKYCPEYLKIYDKEKAKKLGTTGQSLDRDMITMMRPVSFDKNGRPISGMDRKNHEWNLKWLNSVMEDKTDESEKMIKQELPKLFTGGNDIPRPTKAQLKKPTEYMAVLDKYCDDLIKNGEYKAFLAECNKGTAYDSLKKMSKSAAEFDKSNPHITSRCAVINSFGYYLDYHLMQKYWIQANGEVIPVSTKADAQHGERQMKMVPMMKQSIIGTIVKQTEEYYALKEKQKKK